MNNNKSQTQHRDAEHHHTVQTVAAAVVIIVGCAVLVAGLFMPPAGEIHGSVLVAFGEALTFAGACMGMNYHYKYRYGNHT